MWTGYKDIKKRIEKLEVTVDKESVVYRIEQLESQKKKNEEKIGRLEDEIDILKAEVRRIRSLDLGYLADSIEELIGPALFDLEDLKKSSE